MLDISADSVYLSQKEFRNELREHNIDWAQSLEQAIQKMLNEIDP